MGGTAAIDDVWHEFMKTRQLRIRDRLIIEYIPFVRLTVSRLGIPPLGFLEPEDLVSYGIVGLINAIDRFDPTRGIRFETFALPRIRGAVIDQLRALNWQPRTAISRIRRIEHTLATLEQRLGRPASEKEAVTEMGITTDQYRHMLQEMHTVIFSLDAPLHQNTQDDDAVHLADLLEDRDTLDPAAFAEHHELTSSLHTAIGYLSKREQLLLSLYYHKELTMKEISKLLGVSESRICQLHMQALIRLRTTLKPYLASQHAVSPTPQSKRTVSTPQHTKQQPQHVHMVTVAGRVDVQEHY